ncbi:MAG TPA: FAD-dependent oxidoreductase [Solirubrobacterales bacterium]
MREVDFLLIGGGMASAYCAAELRRRGAEGSILLVGREPDPPYERPPLSKEYLRGASERADAYVHPREWYAENEIELVTGKSVMALDVEQRVAKVQGGEEVRFGKALLATGAMVNLLRAEGAQLDGIHYLRAFGNADAIRADVEDAERVVLIGGSYIGCEVAATLTALGKSCTVVMQEQVALERVFGAEVGRYFQGLLSEHGVRFVPGVSLAEFRGEGRVSAVVTDGGEEVPGDVVVIGAGVRPEAMLARRAGLEVDDGIVCNGRLETSAPGIYAAGDCCSYASARYGRLRVEHWDAALQQGRYAGQAMLGQEEGPFDVVPYFFSDLADWASLEFVGYAPEYDEVVLRGSFEDGAFAAFYLRAGRVVGALSCGRSEDLVPARGLIESGADVSARRAELADPDADLFELVG